MSNPNFNELMADLRLLWKRWRQEEEELREISQSKASTKRMCMEDVERLVEKYSDEPKRLSIFSEAGEE